MAYTWTDPDETQVVEESLTLDNFERIYLHQGQPVLQTRTHLSYKGELITASEVF